MLMWMLAHVSVVGWGVAIREDGAQAVLHVGTHWTNPDGVLRAYQSLLDRALANTDVQADLAALAREHAGTPLGRAYESGPGGILVAAWLAGPVAIPAFMRYRQLTKTIEAEQFIKKMSDGARAYYHFPPQPGLTPVPKHLPLESVGPTPLVSTCCMQGGKCAPDPALWAHPTWQALNFSIEDPHYHCSASQCIRSGCGGGSDRADEADSARHGARSRR